MSRPNAATARLEPTTFRTGGCGELTKSNAGNEVRLCGWVDARRDHGGLIFVDLRDRSGKVQVVFDPQKGEGAFRIAEDLRSEYVVQVTGSVADRAPEAINPRIATGEVEIHASEARILARAETPPFELDAEGVSEDIRLRYRYVDLRRERMLRILEARHRAITATREYLSGRGFLEIETPLLGRSTPEGARDYLVPARLSPGKFYALPQSPQLYKQLLMVAGIDRYFQIAKCLRDEDLRADRQPEFTQVDLEMSFASMEDVLEATEGFIAAMFKAAIGVDLPRPFPRLGYAESMEKYGDDKPDLRFDLQMIDAADFARAGQFPPFARALEEGGVVKAIRGVGMGSMSRKEIDELTRELQSLGAGGLGWMRVKEGSLDGGIAKNFPEEEKRGLVERLQAEEGDLALLVGGTLKPTRQAMAFLRNRIGALRGWKESGKHAVAWVVDFPLFQWNAEEKRWDSEHHPFTAPNPEDAAALEKDPGAVRSLSYDLVVNGYEIASGSVRIHDSDLQSRIFGVLQLGEAEIEQKFGFFRGALRHGAPPHAGLAVGVDRLIAIMVGASSIREVIAFPKSQRGTDMMTGAPSEVDKRQLDELGVILKD